jgi:hypothetical protein
MGQQMADEMVGPKVGELVALKVGVLAASTAKY